MGFLSSEKIGKVPSRNFLIVSGTSWPSLGHLGRQHHVLASVWPSERHFLEEKKAYIDTELHNCASLHAHVWELRAAILFSTSFTVLDHAKYIAF